MQGCIACNKCGELGRCVFRDELYDTLHGKLAGADGLVVGSPTYYAGPNGSLCAILDIKANSRMMILAQTHASHSGL